MELTYREEGNYLVPNLTMDLPQVGFYGQKRYQYLRQHKKMLFNELLGHSQLAEHLTKTDQRAAEMEAYLIREMARRDGVDETMKAEDQMRWVGLMNNIKASAREIVLSEVVYV